MTCQTLITHIKALRFAQKQYARAITPNDRISWQRQIQKLEQRIDEAVHEIEKQQQQKNGLMNNVVYNMDCLKAMREMPDKYFQLSIVDPPYAVGAADGYFGGKASKPSKILGHKANYANHDLTPNADYFQELFRVSKHQIIWGANYYPQHLFHSGWIVWDKLTTGPLSDCELAFQSINKLVEKVTIRWSGCMKQDISAQAKIRIHPNQKPVALYKWLLTHYAKPGDRILDTHVGSGSSRIACYDMGYDFTGYELDPDYYQAQELRFERHKSQLKLFA